MKRKRLASCSVLIILIVLVFAAGPVIAQPEYMAWGNLTGIRVQGHLFEFKTSLCLVGSSLSELSQTAKERQRPDYRLNDNTQTISTQLDDIAFQEKVQDLGNGKVLLTVQARAESDTTLTGAFFCLELPASEYEGADIRLIDSTASAMDLVPVFPGIRGQRINRNVQASVTGMQITSSEQTLQVNIDEPTEIIVHRGNAYFGDPNTRIYFALLTGALENGQSASKSFTLTVAGDIDHTPLLLSLDASRPGQRFDGVGGNFRLQDPQMDPPVIDYNLKNLNVTWGRVEMPWSYWHPDESVDPAIAARLGRLHPAVHQAMLMAQRLAGKNIPVILSAWRAPEWAIQGEPHFRPQNRVYGNPLKPEKMPSIIKSIGSYILYLKQAFGVEPVMFSFNESDLGIYIRQTGEEHAELIKILGSHLASLGLETKMLLGDNSDATTYAFIEPAMQDQETHKYIGALSFHSWRGCDNWTLSIWADTARKMNLPLLVGEGSTDAAAHRYPDIFMQPAYALNEIDTYIRIAAICQARSILQWQLTSDYSVLAGEGIYHSKGSLRPTQRFWNLKQLGLTPQGAFYLPVTGDCPDVSCVALGDIVNGIYTIHLVNNGASREVTLSGLPGSVDRMQVFITDDKRGMEKSKNLSVVKGQVKFTLEPACFVSLISEG